MAQLSVNQTIKSEPKGKFKAGLVRFYKQLDLQLMVIPALILIFIFSYIPMYGIMIAFQDYKIGP